VKDLGGLLTDPTSGDKALEYVWHMFWGLIG